jgi:folylpolyglutamate synthase/dihydropteroate synthase
MLPNIRAENYLIPIQECQVTTHPHISEKREAQPCLDTMLQTAASQAALANYEVPQPSDLFNHVIFCTNITTPANLERDIRIGEREAVLTLARQQELTDAWKKFAPGYPKENVQVMGTIQDAVNLVGSIHGSAGSGDTDVLVTGSFYLVGGLLEVAGLEDLAFA